MDYPIFNSIVNHIHGELKHRDLPIRKFKKWREEAINASGLEITIDLTETTPFISHTDIYMDWDKFREVRLAKQLNGMQKHPLLNTPKVPEANIYPNIDVEVTWHFNEQMVLDDDLVAPDAGGKVELASMWMQQINHHLTNVMPSDHVANRWHVELEGDGDEKYLSDMNLISYLQYSMQGQEEINSIKRLVTLKFQELLILTNRIVKVAEQSFPRTVA